MSSCLFYTKRLGGGCRPFDHLAGVQGSTGTVASGENTFLEGAHTERLTAHCGDWNRSAVVLDDIGDEPCGLVRADFTATTSGLALQFISKASDPEPQTAFAWTFGDGTERKGPDPTHSDAALRLFAGDGHLVESATATSTSMA